MDGTKEKFAIVNAQDLPIFYVYGKENLHNQPPGHFHRSVHVFVEINGGRFMLQLKSPGTENAGKWSSAVSGHVRASESYKEAAIRETKEEIGLTIDSSELERVAVLHPCEETGWEFTALFTYLMNDNVEQIKLNASEVTEIRVHKLDDIIKDVDDHADLYSPAFVILLNIFLELYKV